MELCFYDASLLLFFFFFAFLVILPLYLLTFIYFGALNVTGRAICLHRLIKASPQTAYLKQFQQEEAVPQPVGRYFDVLITSLTLSVWCRGQRSVGVQAGQLCPGHREGVQAAAVSGHGPGPGQPELHREAFQSSANR